MSEALANPDTTLETGADAAKAPDRREGLAAALDALEPTGEAEATTLATEAPQAASTATEAVEPAPEPEPWTAPPASWKKQAALYEGLPPEAKQYVFQREEEMRRGVEPLIPKAKFADEVNGVISQYQQNLQAAGVPPVAAIQTLMQADHILRNAPPEQKVAYARQLLQQYGVDLGDGFTPEPVDPRYAALEGRVNQVWSTVQSTQQQAAQQQQDAMETEIASFASEAGHEHFEALRPRMAELVKAGLAHNLSEAYNKALRLDDDLFAAQQAEQQAGAEAAKKAAAHKAAQTARAAAVSVRSSTPGAPAPSKANDRRSLLVAGFDGLSERV